MLFISDNNKIDAIIKELQPSLKLKINIERDFDCGLNDVFEKRPDVVFIQSQIAGVTGESVARHIQLLLGGTAPKFILVHDGDTKAKPKKGLYEYLIDLSQSEKVVVTDILEKLHLLLGPKWQNIFVTSVHQSDKDEALTPAPEPPRDPASSFAFDIVPGVEPVVPIPAPSEFPMAPLSETVLDGTFDVISPAYGQCPENTYEERKTSGAKEKSAVSGGNSPAGEIPVSSKSAASLTDSELSAALLQKSTQAVAGSPVASGTTEKSAPVVDKSTGGAVPPSFNGEDSQPPFKTASADKKPLVSAGAYSYAAEKQSSSAGHGDVTQGIPPVTAQKELQWAFEGEPALKKSTWKRYQFLELLLVLCLLLGGGYLIKQKMQPSKPVEDVNLLTAAVPSPIMQAAAPEAQQPRPVALPSFVPLAGLDPAFALQNAGWERYVGAGVEYRLFRENGKLKAVQVKAEKGQVISEPLLQSILVELAGSAEYQVKSRGNKLGFQVSSATINGKAEVLIYRKNAAVHAFVVSLD